ncbi:MAG: hypothetical protein HC917_06800 [Richelia sp. SM2_1_7]|nr:hypothetical protein [Richelia sp. SM2_1_7]
MKTLSREQKIILNGIKNLPPKSLLLLCTTRDLLNALVEKHAIYQNLHDELKSYFSGEPSPLPDIIQDPIILRAFQLKAKVYIDLYEVIRDGWNCIKHGSEILCNCSDIDESDWYVAKTMLEAKSPGELLTIILSWESSEEFDRCRFHHKVSPRKTYTQYSNHRKAQRIKGMSVLTNEEKAFLERNEREITQQTASHRGGSITLRCFCLALCNTYVKHHKKKQFSKNP